MALLVGLLTGLLVGLVVALAMIADKPWPSEEWQEWEDRAR